jgi:hypothetical protein
MDVSIAIAGTSTTTIITDMGVVAAALLLIGLPQRLAELSFSPLGRSAIWADCEF